MYRVQKRSKSEHSDCGMTKKLHKDYLILRNSAATNIEAGLLKHKQAAEFLQTRHKPIDQTDAPNRFSMLIGK